MTDSTDSPDKQKDKTWTVFTTNQGELITVESGLEDSFLKGEWLSDSPDFVRPAARVSESDISWEEASAFILKHKDGPLPPPAYDEDFEPPTPPESGLSF